MAVQLQSDDAVTSKLLVPPSESKDWDAGEIESAQPITSGCQEEDNIRRLLSCWAMFVTPAPSAFITKSSPVLSKMILVPSGDQFTPRHTLPKNSAGSHRR